MLYMIDRTVENTFVYLKDGQYYRVTEVLKFDFDKKDYKLVDFQIEEIAHLKGGDK